MIIKINLKCHKSSDYPALRIKLNDNILCDTVAHEEFLNLSFDVAAPLEPSDHVLKIQHYNKQDSDTWSDADGNITADKAIEIQALSIDGYNIPRNIIFKKKFYPVWPLHFDLDNMPEYISNNNFLGFNGTYEFDFKMPMAQEYYGYFWQMELDANVNLQKTDETSKEEYFEAYGMKIKIDDALNFTLTDLKKLIEQHEK